MTEKRFENALKSNIKTIWSSAHVKKIASEWVGGIPDLHVKIPGFSQMWLELKYVRRASFKGVAQNPIKIELTDLQRNFIRKERTAGGCAGWLIMVDFVGNQQSVLFSSSDPEIKYLSQEILKNEGVWGKKYSRTKDEFAWLFTRIILNQTGTTMV